jgi:hypothetical protein
MRLIASFTTLLSIGTRPRLSMNDHLEKLVSATITALTRLPQSGEHLHKPFCQHSPITIYGKTLIEHVNYDGHLTPA